MKGFYATQVRGAMIQLASIVSIVSQNFLAPRVLGAEEFGLAVLLLSTPLVVQGLAEPVLMSLTIRWSSRGEAAGEELDRLAALWRDLFAWSAAGAALCIAFALHTLGAAEWERGLALGAWVAGLLLLTVNTIAVLGLAYRADEYRALLRFYLLSGAVLPAGLLLFSSWGAAGFFFSLSLIQVLGCASLLAAERIRTPYLAVLRRLRGGAGAAASRGDYASLLAPRLAVVLFSVVTVLLASFHMGLEQVAALKVTLSLVAAGTYALPVSPWMLQAALTATGEDGAGRSRRHGAVVLGAVFASGCVLAAVLYVWGGVIRSHVLGVGYPAADLDPLFLSLPFFVLINPLSSYLIAHGEERYLTWGLGAAVLCMAGGFATGHLVGAFVLGTMAFVGVSAGLASRAGRPLVAGRVEERPLGG